MPNDQRQKQPPKKGIRPVPQRPRTDKKSEEVLREQAKTETEERPYLDTEGGE